MGAPAGSTGELLAALSTALDFTAHGLSAHHRRVAYAALEVGKAAGLGTAETGRVYTAALIHDLGAPTFVEKMELHRFEVASPFEHCARGAALAAAIPGLEGVAEVILSHHDRWDGANPSGLAGEAVPVESRLIHLCDRLDVLIDAKHYILDQADVILARLKDGAKSLFDPLLYQALEDVAARESFWLDLVSWNLPELLREKAGRPAPGRDGAASLAGIAGMFARVVDSKSPFTHRHSRLVARVAGELAARLGFGAAERERVYIAGLLHDLGKLSVPEAVLDKPGRLTAAEYRVIKRHTYYTYHILRRVPGLEEIAGWAAYHHERLDGRGYPFHLRGAELSTGARLMAVADLFAALVEDRPYRPGLPRMQVESIIRDQVRDGAVDGEIAGVLLADYESFAALDEVFRP